MKPQDFTIHIEQDSFDIIDKALALATEYADDALNAEIAAEQLTREADRLADQAQNAQTKAEEARAEANSLTVNTTIALCKGIVEFINNATPAQLNTFYFEQVVKRIIAIANAEKVTCTEDLTTDRMYQRIAAQIADFNRNPNA